MNVVLSLRDQGVLCLNDNHSLQHDNYVFIELLLMTFNQSAMQKPQHMHLASTHNEPTTAVSSNTSRCIHRQTC